MSRLEQALNFVGIALKHDPRPADRATNITLAVACALMVLLPFFFTYSPATNDVKISKVSLPAMCLSRACFNTDCPGCGLTRSFISLTQGKLDASLRLHRLAPLLYCFFLFQIMFRLWSLRSSHSAWLQRAGLINHYAGWVLIICLLANWAIGLALKIGN